MPAYLARSVYFYTSRLILIYGSVPFSREPGTFFSATPFPSEQSRPLRKWRYVQFSAATPDKSPESENTSLQVRCLECTNHSDTHFFFFYYYIIYYLFRILAANKTSPQSEPLAWIDIKYRLDTKLYLRGKEVQRSTSVAGTVLTGQVGDLFNNGGHDKKNFHPT